MVTMNQQEAVWERCSGGEDCCPLQVSNLPMKAPLTMLAFHHKGYQLAKGVG